MPSRLQVANTRRAISPRLATSTRVIIWDSHPEDAEVRRPLDRGIGDGGQAHSQYGAGVARIDDPVVVEPAGQEHRQRLGLDLCLDRGPQRGVGILVDLLTPD